MEPDAKTSAGIAFGRFLLLPHRRELLADGRPTGLGGRAFDLLLALIEARGNVVGKEELAARVWPGQIVQDTALQSQISALRAALGADRGLIRTVSGRGYQFGGDLRDDPVPGIQVDAGTAPMSPQQTHPSTNLPEPVSPLIGRDNELRAIVELAAGHRLVTLAGAGGIGKTRLATEAARQLMPRFGDGVWMVDLSTVSDPGLIPGAIALAAELDIGGRATQQLVAQALATRSTLLMLDNCEHLVGGVAVMAEELMHAGTAVHVIATSREALRADGEWVFPVLPLAVPADLSPDDDPRHYAAVQLFIERAQAVHPRFVAGPDDAATIAAICRRLDGIPLAIELAAARTAVLSLDQLFAHLDNLFDLLISGRRTALPRHQTLRATLDWSYKLLPEPERAVFCRLAVFTGAFSLDAALAVVADVKLPQAQVLQHVSELVTKSLLVTETDHNRRYRLLDTVRTYALEKLAQSGEADLVARRHAEYYLKLFEKSATEWQNSTAQKWTAEYAPKIGNLRTALDWAFSPGGDKMVAVALTAAAVTLWMQLSLMQECRTLVEQALAIMETEEQPDDYQQMRLQAALGSALLYTRGEVSQIGVCWTKTLEIADRRGDVTFQQTALWGLWSFYIGRGNMEGSLDCARRFNALAVASPHVGDRHRGELMTGASLHYLGKQAVAQQHIERFCAVSPAGTRYSPNLAVAPNVMALVYLARILWLRGLVDQARRIAANGVAEAQELGHPNSLCYALALAAFPIALFVGEQMTMARYLDMLNDYSARYGLARWSGWANRYEGVLLIQRGEIDRGLHLLYLDPDSSAEATFSTLVLIVIQMAEALGRIGRRADCFGLVGELIDLSDRNEESWRAPEVLRIAGELRLLQDKDAASAVEDCFRQALDLARQQGALSWELRVATSLARLLCDHGRSSEARETLQPVYLLFNEGFDTADLRSARELLTAIG